MIFDHRSLLLGLATLLVSGAAQGEPRSGYQAVNGLRMYYEIHTPDREKGAVPVLLLHGAYMTTGDFGPLLPGLAATRRVVVCDLQGHGRTGDLDRPLVARR
jgi:pimeloyl-ACP methyl ester carboxylesterase